MSKWYNASFSPVVAPSPNGTSQSVPSESRSDTRGAGAPPPKPGEVSEEPQQNTENTEIATRDKFETGADAPLSGAPVPRDEGGSDNAPVDENYETFVHDLAAEGPEAPAENYGTMGLPEGTPLSAIAVTAAKLSGTKAADIIVNILLGGVGSLNLASATAAMTRGRNTAQPDSPKEAYDVLLEQVKSESSVLGDDRDVSQAAIKTINGLLKQAANQGISKPEASKDLRIAAWMFESGGLPRSAMLARALGEYLRDNSATDFREQLSNIFGDPSSGQPVDVATLESAPKSTLEGVSTLLALLLDGAAPNAEQLKPIKAVLQGIFGIRPGTPAQIASEAATLLLRFHGDKFADNPTASQNAVLLANVLQDIQSLAEDNPAVIEQVLSA